MAARVGKQASGRPQWWEVAVPYGLLLLAAALVALLTGCSNVHSYEWKYLADPIMDRNERLAELDREQKWLEAREGSIGGASGAGGGCACK